MKTLDSLAPKQFSKMAEDSDDLLVFALNFVPLGSFLLLALVLTSLVKTRLYLELIFYTPL